MKTKFRKLTVLLICFAAGLNDTSAQVYSQEMIGYINHTFAQGNNLFSNPFDAGDNSLTNLFSQYGVLPDGVTVSLWDPVSETFSQTSTYSGGSWSLNLLMPPGTGALLNSSQPFTITFAGNVEDHDGSALLTSYPTPPPVFSGPSGIYLLGDKCPWNNVGTDVFLNVLGRLPNPGEQVLTLNSSSTYLGDGNWDKTPVLDASDAVFFNLTGSAVTPNFVPEPSTMMLGLFGCALAIACRRRIRKVKTKGSVLDYEHSLL